jgi:hypothetical protein
MQQLGPNTESPELALYLLNGVGSCLISCEYIALFAWERTLIFLTAAMEDWYLEIETYRGVI